MIPSPLPQTVCCAGVQLMREDPLYSSYSSTVFYNRRFYDGTVIFSINKEFSTGRVLFINQLFFCNQLLFPCPLSISPLINCFTDERFSPDGVTCNCKVNGRRIIHRRTHRQVQDQPGGREDISIVGRRMRIWMRMRMKMECVESLHFPGEASRRCRCRNAAAEIRTCSLTRCRDRLMTCMQLAGTGFIYIKPET